MSTSPSVILPQTPHATQVHQSYVQPKFQPTPNSNVKSNQEPYGEVKSTRMSRIQATQNYRPSSQPSHLTYFFTSLVIAIAIWTFRTPLKSAVHSLISSSPTASSELKQIYIQVNSPNAYFITSKTNRLICLNTSSCEMEPSESITIYSEGYHKKQISKEVLIQNAGLFMNIHLESKSSTTSSTSPSSSSIPPSTNTPPKSGTSSVNFPSTSTVNKGGSPVKKATNQASSKTAKKASSTSSKKTKKKQESRLPPQKM